MLMKIRRGVQLIQNINSQTPYIHLTWTYAISLLYPYLPTPILFSPLSYPENFENSLYNNPTLEMVWYKHCYDAWNVADLCQNEV